jgi:hypothetical protein
MHLLATHPYTEIDLHWDSELAGPPELRARQLRGALAAAFPGNSLFHQRDATGRQIYRYPLVQYRWASGRGLVAGWGEGAELLRGLPWLDLKLSLGEQRVAVTDAHISCRNAELGVSPRLLHYRLLSPVLLFNQDNFRRFQDLQGAERQQEQDRLLTAQLLTALRGLGVEFPQHLYATLTDVHPRKVRYKQHDLLGCAGRFACNALLPPGFAFGHAVSHGFGWIRPAEDAAPWS